MDKIKNMMLTKVLAIVLTLLILFSAVSSLFVISANATTDDSKTTVYLMTDSTQSPIYMYSWKGEDSSFANGEIVTTTKKDSKTLSLWKFSVADKIDGAIFTSENSWKDDDDVYNESIKLSGDVKNKVSQSNLYFELIGKSDLTEKEFSEFKGTKATLTDSTVNAVYGNEVTLVDLSKLSLEGTLKDYDVTYSIFKGDEELVFGKTGELKYTFESSKISDSKVTLTLKAKDIAGNIEECGNITVNLYNDNEFKFEHTFDTKAYNANGIEIQKIEGFGDVTYTVDCDVKYAEIVDGKLKVYKGREADKANEIVGLYRINAETTIGGKKLTAHYDMIVKTADKDWSFEEGKNENVNFGQKYSIELPDKEERNVSYSVDNASKNFVTIEGNELTFTKYTSKSVTVNVKFNGDDFYKEKTATYTVNCILGSLDNIEGYLTIESEGKVKVKDNDYNKDVTIYGEDGCEIAKVDNFDSIVVSEIVWKDSITLNENIENPKFLVKDSEGVILKYTSDIRIDKNSPSGEIKLFEGSDISWKDLLTTNVDFTNFIQTINKDSNVPLCVTAEDNDSNFTSDLKSVQYYVDEPNDITIPLTREKLESIESNDWKDTNKQDGYYLVSATLNKKSVVYIKITDNFNNVTYISTNGLVSETTEPDCEINIANDQDLYEKFGYYNQDVKVNVTDIVDKGDLQSGVKSVKFTAKDKNDDEIKIDNNYITSEFESGLTFTIPIKNFKNLGIQEISYEVTVTDNCGNQKTKVGTAKVCSDSKFKIDLDGYNDNTQTTVYKQSTADCTVTYITTGEKDIDSTTITSKLKNLFADEYKDISVNDTLEWVSDKNGCYTAKVTLTSDDNEYNLGLLEGSIASSNLPDTLVFDTTAPKITVSYNDKNDVHNEKYFSKKRKAKIKVEEKNFDPDRVRVDIKANGNDYSVSLNWKTDNQLTYYTEVTFENENDYTNYSFGISCIDKSENKNEPVCYGESVAPTEFVLDNENPVIDIRYDNNMVKNQKYYNQDRTATITIKEHNFNTNGVECTVKSSSIAPTLSSWTHNGDEHTAKIIFNKDGEYNFEFNFTDLSGRKGKENNYYTKFIVDKTAPQVTIAYDNNNVLNNKFFGNSRKATVTVTDTNFKGSAKMVAVKATDKDNKEVTAPTIKWNGKVGTFNCSKDAYYTVSIDKTEFVDLAGNKAVVSTKGQKAPYNFVIDGTVPTAKVVVKDTAGNTVGKEKDKFSSNISFKNYTNKKSYATVTYDDKLEKSSDLVAKYYVSEKPVSLSTLKALKESKWKKYSKSVYFTPDRQFVVYAKVTDKANNIKYISSDGIILDKTKPNIDGISPNIKLDIISNTPKKSIHGYNLYNGDVVVDYQISDPIRNNTCSGINKGSLSYEVKNGNTVTQSGKLKSLSGKITVSASKNNSNNVILTVKASDNAGNESQSVAKLKIDITRPQISVSYDNNSALNSKLFKDNRTATIVVRERNFDLKKVNVIATADGSNYPVSLSWTTNGQVDTDSYEHIATITYSDSKDYTFDINCEDEATNKNSGVNYGTSVAPRDFTVDKVAPQVTVSYDNNSVENDNYYNQDRTATITVNEHNFNAGDVVCNVTSTGATPTLSSWSTSGDTHTATIAYSEDAKYSFSFDYTDMAGNKCNTVPIDEFYVDKTAPKITLDGVNYHSANNGDVVGFTLTATDDNGDSNTFETKLQKVELNGKNKDITHLYEADTSNGNEMKYTVGNIDDDGVYVVKCSVKDLAGNSTDSIVVADEKGKSVSKDTVEFSVNRQGSTFIIDKNTKSVVDKGYIQKVENDVEITEINPNKIKSVKLQLETSGANRELEENKDYTVKENFSDTSWNTCKYIVKSSCFDKEAEYVLSLETKDKAGNTSFNDTKNPSYSKEDIAKISFVVDRTCPKVLVDNLESNGRYNTDKQKVNIVAEDENQLSKLQIFLNGKLFKEYSQKQISDNRGQFTLEINSSDDLQTLKVVGVDLAGNSTDDKGNEKVEYKDFLVTTNFWIQYINNTVALVITVAVILLIAGAVALITVKKKRNK